MWNKYTNQGQVHHDNYVTKREKPPILSSNESNPDIHCTIWIVEHASTNPWMRWVNVSHPWSRFNMALCCEITFPQAGARLLNNLSHDSAFRLSRYPTFRILELVATSLLRLIIIQSMNMEWVILQPWLEIIHRNGSTIGTQKDQSQFGRLRFYHATIVYYWHNTYVYTWFSP